MIVLIFWKLILVNNKSIKMFKMVMKIVKINGMWKSKFRVIVVLIILVMLVVMMVNLVINYKIILRVFFVWVWMVCVRFIWFMILSLVVMYCNNIVIKFEIRMVVIKVY